MIVVFVAEIAGCPVLALNAEAHEAALQVLAEPGVRLDLQQFQAVEGPLWNGVDEIVLREPDAQERALWEASFFKAQRDGEVGLEDALRETWICFLVAVTPPAISARAVSRPSPRPPGRWSPIGRKRRSRR